MHTFLLAIRDAHGVVTRPLLTAYATTLGSDVQKNFLSISDKRQDRFKVETDVCYRTPSHLRFVHMGLHKGMLFLFSGVQQFLPANYKEKIVKYHNLLRSMMAQRHYKRIIVGDETGIRMEEIPATTLESRGAKRVPMRTSGKEKQMFTVWLSAEAQEQNGEWVATKNTPMVMFKGATGGKVKKEIAAAAGARAAAITTENGWMNGDSMLQRVRSNLKDAKHPILIQLDSD